MGHIIAVYGTQGGAGCTTVAVNLAIGLMMPRVKVLLMDMNLHYGDVPLFLNLKPQTSLLDCLTPHFDVENLKQIMTTHESGLEVLTAPSSIADAQTIYDNSAKLAHAFDVIQWAYDFIVVDVGRNLDAPTVEILNRATSIVMVMQPTVLGVKNARLTLDWFDQHLYPAEKTVPIINCLRNEQTKQKIAVPRQTIEKYLKRTIEAQLPLEKESVELAIYKGTPLITQHHPASGSLAQALIDFSDYIYHMHGYGTFIPVQPARAKPSSKLFPRAEPSPPPFVRVQFTEPSRSSNFLSSVNEITILLVDDIPEALENIKNLLAFEPDLKVIGTATNGMQAIEMAKELKPNIVLMDIDMPEMNGIEATELITKGIPTVSVILMDVESGSETVRHAMLAGARYFLSKPISSDELYNTIRSVFEQLRPKTPDTRKWIH